MTDRPVRSLQTFRSLLEVYLETVVPQGKFISPYDAPAFLHSLNLSTVSSRQIILPSKKIYGIRFRLSDPLPPAPRFIFSKIPNVVIQTSEVIDFKTKAQLQRDNKELQIEYLKSLKNDLTETKRFQDFPSAQALPFLSSGHYISPLFPQGIELSNLLNAIDFLITDLEA